MARMSKGTPIERSQDIPNRLVSPKVATALSLIQAGQQLYTTGKAWYNRYFTYFVSVTEDQSIYQDVQDWILRSTPHERHKHLKVVAQKRQNYEEGPTSDDSSGGPHVSPLRFQLDDDVTRYILIDGHKVQVRVQVPDLDNKSDTYLKMYAKPKEIVFRCFSYEAQQIVIQKLEKINQARAVSRKAVLKMVGMWGSWRTRSDLPPRTMDSVSIPLEQKERIMADMRSFLGAEERYNRLAIPWHRGYMFHGPPGTGKTSLVKALANEFNLDLWYISLSDLKTENSLLDLISDVGPRSLLLLEDIDTIKISHDRDAAEAGSISMGSLLNTLDGVATPHGLITVMTTNRFDILDPALTRAGRMDMVEELGYPSKETVGNLFKHFYGIDIAFGEDFEIGKTSTAQIAEIFKRNFENSDGAMEDLTKLLIRKN